MPHRNKEPLVPTTTKIPAQLKRKLERQARKAHVTLSHLMRRILDDGSKTLTIEREKKR